MKGCVAIALCVAVGSLSSPSLLAQDMPAEYQRVLTTLGKEGDFKANVLKVNIPRNTLRVGKGGAPATAATATSAPAGGQLDAAKITQIVGAQGEQNGAVYKITVGRDDLKLTEMGAPINARMGLNTWAAFVGTNDNAAIAGDVAMLPNEVTPVLKALRKNGLDVVAIHHHMTQTQPTIFFLHYWGTGPAEKLAAGFTAALAELGKRGASASK